MPEENTEIKYIESDLKEEIFPLTFTFPVIVPTIFSLAVTTTHPARGLSQTDFPKHNLSQNDLSHILSATNGTDLISSAPIPISIPFFTLTTLLSPF